MEVEIKHFKRYRYELINASPESKKVLFVLHGYGQLAKFFIRKFQHLPKDLMIVAPEGMHRFYLKGSSGRVGASWMTKEARESDIADNLEWLSAMENEISKSYPIEKRFLLGFSQGGATAARWEANGSINFDALILWACIFPPDISASNSPAKSNSSYFVIGTEDEFYTNDEQQKLIEFYESLGYTTNRYEGKHDIHNETLSDIIRQIN